MEVLQRTANRGSLSTGFNINNSVKLEADNTEFFSRTPSSNSNRQTFTYSTWVKRTELGINGAILDAYQDGSNFFLLQFDTSDRFVVYQVDSGTDYGYHYTRRYRDTSAWYHIVFVSDTTNGTAADRYQLYVNGERISNSDIDTDYGTPPQNYNNNLNSTILHHIGKRGDGAIYNSCYLAETHLVDGTALAPTAFGEVDDSGIWKPIEVDVTYGTNGFYLNYVTASDMGDDKSGNGNDFAETNITAADQATDSPMNNFCTLVSPQQFVPSKTASLVKEGGTTMFGGNVQGAYSSMGIRSGKWYFESTITNSGGVGTENHGFGCIAANRLYEMNIAGEDIGADVGGWACAGNANPRNNNAGASGANYVTSPAVDVVLGCAIDMDNGKIWWHNAGTWHSLNNTVGNPANGTSPAWSNLLTATDDFVLPAAGLYQTGSAIRVMNFGGYALPVFTAVGTYSDANGHGSFSYAPPTGYYALCTKNLAEYG